MCFVRKRTLASQLIIININDCDYLLNANSVSASVQDTNEDTKLPKGANNVKDADQIRTNWEAGG